MLRNISDSEYFTFTDAKDLLIWLEAFRETDLSAVCFRHGEDDHLTVHYETEVLSDGSKVNNISIAGPSIEPALLMVDRIEDTESRLTALLSLLESADRSEPDVIELMFNALKGARDDLTRLKGGNLEPVAPAKDEKPSLIVTVKDGQVQGANSTADVDCHLVVLDLDGEQGSAVGESVLVEPAKTEDQIIIDIAASYNLEVEDYPETNLDRED